MLTQLRIRNLALMDGVSLEFGPGFTVVTGETGAGKSVLLGALGLLAGNRAAKTVVRRGAEQCEVDGVLEFSDPRRVDARLDELGLPACEEGRLLLRRTVHSVKAGRVTVNGAPATLAQLEALGELWIDFHGPGEPQKLFSESRQLEMLDRHAGNEVALAAYASLHSQWRALLERARELSSREKLSEDEAVFLASQIERMESVDISDEGVAALERDFSRASKSREYAGFAARMDAGLGSEDGLSAAIPGLLRAAREMAAIDPAAVALESRLNALAVEIEDLRADYSRIAGEPGFDEEALSDLGARMNLWLDLRRKHGPDAASVRAKRDSLRERLSLRGGVDAEVASLEAAASGLESSLREAAAKLTLARVRAAGELAVAARSLFGGLGFRKADLRILILETGKLSETGDSACRFLFTANAGQEPLPLNHIASSGETARVMLALKTVLAGVDRTPVLVFDEVDANVGGEIGARVGVELAALSARHQVFCVTHLPQVAARGVAHYRVVKSHTDEATTVSIEPLHDSREEREGELARMLGDRGSAAALSHARELLGGS